MDTMNTIILEKRQTNRVNPKDTKFSEQLNDSQK